MKGWITHFPTYVCNKEWVGLAEGLRSKLHI